MDSDLASISMKHGQNCECCPVSLFIVRSVSFSVRFSIVNLQWSRVSRAILWGRSLNGFALFLSLINVRHSMITSLVREASGRQKDAETFSATLIERLKAWKSLSLLFEDIWSACFSSKGQSAWSLITKPSDLRLWCHHGFLLSQSSSSPALSTQPEQAMRCNEPTSS